MTDIQYNTTPITRRDGQSRPYFEGTETGEAKVAEVAESGDFYPWMKRGDMGGGRLHVDPGGWLGTRGGILTDAGSFRVNFTGSELGFSIGSCVFTNGSTTVTGTGFGTNISAYDYIKLDADGATAWARVYSIVDDNTIELETAYTGTGGTGASTCSVVKPTIGTGGTIAVANGACTLGSGTTATSTTKLTKAIDYTPLRIAFRASISQRAANQGIYFGLTDKAELGYYYARFLADGTTNTTIKCQTAFNATEAPSANETESTIVTLPAGLTTADTLDYVIEAEQHRVNFFVNGVLVGKHEKVCIPPYNELTFYVMAVNTSYAGTNTNVVVDYILAETIENVKVAPFTVNDQRSNYALVTATSAGVVARSGTLTGLLIAGLTATPTAGTLTIYDNTAGSGTKLWEQYIPATIATTSITLPNIAFAKGISIVYTTLANVNVGVFYR